MWDFANLFDELDKFFLSINDYLSFNLIFWIFVGLFLLTGVIALIVASHTYEAKLIKTIDRFNNYFASNPQITEDNLLQFNSMMKSNRVPKQIRKQWQQFVLYRDKVASEYFNYDICVSSPLKNSGYKRDIKVMNILSYIYIALAIVLNVYCMYENVTDLAWFFQHLLLTPVLILLLNFLLTIYMDARYNAIVADIYSNFQYFTTNMDKATSTIPEYVDYEVLFDKNEIKRGIPILYAYLQRRAEEEKRELDRARLKNVEHEKFNFDEAGVESSLVLERAMQEAENYIAERKKYLEDVEQINSEISQEEINFRETTKEYQRQMQVSKESFANFKDQLENASSAIETNYIKKQQQQELDRQRNLERDYDTATDNHKRVIDNFQAELTQLETDIKKSRNNLEKAMMSEFSTYSSKVYDAAKKLIDQREEAQKTKLRQEIKALEEKLVAKDQELDNIYAQNQQLNSKIMGSGESVNMAEIRDANNNSKNKKNDDDDGDDADSVDNSLPAQDNQTQTNASVPQENVQPQTEDNTTQEDLSASGYTFNYLDDEPSQPSQPSEEVTDGEFKFDYLDDMIDEDNKPENETKGDAQTIQENAQNTQENPDAYNFTFNYQDDDKGSNTQPQTTANELPTFDYLGGTEDEEQTEPKIDNNDVEVQQKPRKSPGRPRKVQTEQKPKRGRGRPKKQTNTTSVTNSVRTESTTPSKTVSKGRGRPKKSSTATATTATTPKKVGRPRKTETASTSSNATSAPKKAGRPRKTTAQTALAQTNDAPKRKVGRPRKTTAQTSLAQTNDAPERKVGRPRKTTSEQVSDIDAVLQEIDAQIAEENQKIEQSTKELEKNSKNITRRKS